MHKNHKGGGARTAQLKIAKKPVYFALDQRLVRRHKTLLFLTGLGQAAAVLVVMISGLAPNIGNRAYAGSGAYSGPHGSDVFVMLVDTTKPGALSDTQFQVRPSTSGLGIDYSVDCNDDGNFEVTGQTDVYTCNYAEPGVYSVVLDGTLRHMRYNGNGEVNKILEVQQWGTETWSSFESAFYGASNLQITATDTPNLSNVTDMSYMFGGATSFNSNISSWDVSHVTNMSGMFRGATSFNQDISSWNTGSVTNMSEMLRQATSFNQDISSWDVSHVTNISFMFHLATAFNQPLNNWDVSSATAFNEMFNGAALFNQPIGGWNTGNATNMSFMFQGATAFNQDISNWDTSHVINMSSMFEGATAFNQPLNDWNVSSLISTVSMFRNASSFNQPLNNWDTSGLYNIEGMFSGASSFNQPLNSWDTSGLSGDTRWVFQYASSFNQPLNNWVMSGVTSTYRMFAGATAFNQDISNWDTSHVINMSSMFEGATAFNQDIGGLDMSAVTNASSMLVNSGLTPDTYDLILTGWSSQLLHSNVTFGASGKSYCTASLARQSIIDNFNWTINDAGQACMPEISTGGVVSVTDDSATLQINIIDDGGGSVYDAGIQYGTDFMNYSGTQSADSFSEGVQQVQISSGLTCETTYYYRAFIHNGAGTAYGNNSTFTTAACPPPPQQLDLRLRASLLNTAPVRTGDTVNYQLKAKNLGPGSTNGAIFYVNIPHETNYGSATFNVPDSFDSQCYNQGPIQEVDGGGPLWNSYTGDLIVCQVFSDTGYINSGDELTMNLSLTAASNFQEGSSVLRGLLIGDEDNEIDMPAFFSAIQSGTPVFDVPINNIVNLVYGQGDSDGDGVYDNVENAAPNNGDANNDGTADSAQPNVTSLVSPVTGKYAVLAVDASCEISNIAIRPESSNAAQDKSNDYPNGLMDFNLDCGENGFTANITQYYYGTKKDGFSVRKYNPSTKTYSTIETASISESTVAAQTVTQATYQVKDGSSLDLDGIEDGNIHDPAGLARKDWLAGTGQNLTLALYSSFTLVTLGGSAYVLRRARRRSHPTYNILH